MQFPRALQIVVKACLRFSSLVCKLLQKLTRLARLARNQRQQFTRDVLRQVLIKLSIHMAVSEHGVAHSQSCSTTLVLTAATSDDANPCQLRL